MWEGIVVISFPVNGSVNEIESLKKMKFNRQNVEYRTFT